MKQQMIRPILRKPVRASLLLIAGLLWGIASTSAAAEWKPDKRVEFIVPSSAGGGNDRITRLAHKLVQDGRLGNHNHTALGLVALQIAYWEGVFAKMVVSDDWKKMVARDVLAADYRRSAETRDFLRTQYEEQKAVLTDLGLVKQQ